VLNKGRRGWENKKRKREPPKRNKKSVGHVGVASRGLCSKKKGWTQRGGREGLYMEKRKKGREFPEEKAAGAANGKQAGD